MDGRDYLPIFVHLTKQYPGLIFWKHFDRGILGEGDIDTLIAKEHIASVSASFRELVFRVLPTVHGIVESSVLEQARLNFVVTNHDYPKLFEFDIGALQSRAGLVWGDPTILKEFTVLSAGGIRVLSPGTLAVALLLLYGLSFAGKNKLKIKDHEDVIYGLRNDYDTALRTVECILPARMKVPFKDLLKAIKYHDWSEKGIQKSWCHLIGWSFRQSLVSPAFAFNLLRQKSSRFIFKKRHRLSFERKAQFSSENDFLMHYKEQRNYKVFVRLGHNKFEEI